MKSMTMMVFNIAQSMPRNQQQNNYYRSTIWFYEKAIPKKKYLGAYISNLTPLKTHNYLLQNQYKEANSNLSFC